MTNPPISSRRGAAPNIVLDGLTSSSACQVALAGPGSALDDGSHRRKTSPKLDLRATGERARYVIVMAHNVFALIEEIHASADRDPATMGRLFESYASELL